MTPLPDPEIVLFDSALQSSIEGYTAQQMHTYARAARAPVLDILADVLEAYRLLAAQVGNEGAVVWAARILEGRRMTDLVKLARQRIDDRQRTHWEGCERDHRECLIQRMADEIERLHRADLALNVLEQISELMDAVIEDAQQEFVKVPYGASHEDVAAINDWHQKATECRRALATYRGAGR